MKIRLLILFLMLVLLLSACGQDNSTSDKSKDSVSVVETTSDGGKILKDTDDNVITLDGEGNIVSIKDKNGNFLIVEDYIYTHEWLADDSYGINVDKEKVGSKSTISATDANGDVTEGDIPVVIASIPDESDMIELD